MSKTLGFYQVNLKFIIQKHTGENHPISRKPIIFLFAKNRIHFYNLGLFAFGLNLNVSTLWSKYFLTSNVEISFRFTLSFFDVNTVSNISSQELKICWSTPPPPWEGGLNVRLSLWYLKYQYIVQDIGKYVALRPSYKTPARFYYLFSINIYFSYSPRPPSVPL